MNCKFCQKECKNKRSLGSHERLCKNNPNRAESGFKSIKEPWNKGLTKETDKRVKKHAETISKSQKGKAPNFEWTPERRKAKSEWRKNLHKENPESHPNRKLANNRSKMSYPEKVAYDFLLKNNIKFEHQKRILKYYPDFIISDIIIEIDGEYWHNTLKDIERDSELLKAGYKVYRIKAKENIENRIKEILDLK